MAENFLYRALFISLSVHAVILGIAYFNSIHQMRYDALRQNRIEISYKPRQRVVDMREYPVKPLRHLDLSNSQNFFSNGTIPAGLVKERQVLPFGMFYERRPDHMRTMELSRRISITPITSAKINNPVYAAYNEMVRERIKERVYANYDKMETGTVYLTFLLNDRGVLEDAQIVPEKTNASQHLQDISIKSLHEASPFPAFLKGMNLNEYPFNIEIQYQVNGD